MTRVREPLLRYRSCDVTTTRPKVQDRIRDIKVTRTQTHTHIRWDFFQGAYECHQSLKCDSTRPHSLMSNANRWDGRREVTPEYKLKKNLSSPSRQSDKNVLMCWHHFWAEWGVSLKLWLTDRKPDLKRKNMDYDPQKNPLCHTHTHTQSFPFVSSYCFFWVTVKTVNRENEKKKKGKKKKKGVKQETRFRKGQAHSCGSVLQFLITVIGDWLSLLHS